MKKSKLTKNNISERVNNINYSAVRKAFSAGRKAGVINLTIGQPDFDVPINIKNSVKKYIDAGYNRYTETRGILALREGVSKMLVKKNVKRGPEEIIITPGTTAGIYMSLMSLINPGDEIIVFEPYFVAYTEIIELLGGKVILAKTDKNFQPNIKNLKKVISKKAKAIIINSPNNPTGVVYSKKNIEEIVRIAKLYDVYIISDEVYSDFIYDGIEIFSPAKIYQKTILLDGLSKSKGMTGWRIGYVAGPKEIIDAVEKIQQFSFVCAPAPFQYASIEALDTGLDQVVIDRYKTNRDEIYLGLKEVCDLTLPQGAFYAFIKTPIGGEKITDLLLKDGAAVVPGSAFGKNYSHYIRISYATTLEKIKKAVSIIKKVLNKI